ncbi:MAG: nuclear transport factor 2 family protein [Thermoleophilia bacterium]|nr:nuclear transport factor 2 family protein [Thermoleophilia bacterium]
MLTKTYLLDEVWGKGNLDVTHELLAEDYVRHGPDVEGGGVTGREAFETLIDQAIAAAPARPVSYGNTGVVRGPGASRALPYEMRPLHTREWRA